MKSSKKPQQDFIVSTSWGYVFDDCPVCRAMKEAAAEGRNATSEELDTAFKEAGEKN